MPSKKKQQIPPLGSITAEVGIGSKPVRNRKSSTSTRSNRASGNSKDNELDPLPYDESDEELQAARSRLKHEESLYARLNAAQKNRYLSDGEQESGGSDSESEENNAFKLIIHASGCLWLHC